MACTDCDCMQHEKIAERSEPIAVLLQLDVLDVLASSKNGNGETWARIECRLKHTAVSPTVAWDAMSTLLALNFTERGPHEQYTSQPSTRYVITPAGWQALATTHLAARMLVRKGALVNSPT